MPPLPKSIQERQRRNAPKSHAVLDPGRRVKQPKLPALAEGREYHPMTVAWWRDVWRSPMAPEYLAADVHGLYRLAVLVDAFWEGPSVQLEAQILKTGQCFGLSPLDRRRLEWEVAKVEDAKRKRAPRVVEEQGDPRALLRALG